VKEDKLLAVDRLYLIARHSCLTLLHWKLIWSTI